MKLVAFTNELKFDEQNTKYKKYKKYIKKNAIMSYLKNRYNLRSSYFFFITFVHTCMLQ